jgi:predicted nucleic acid-binding Zn ribbon protein
MSEEKKECVVCKNPLELNEANECKLCGAIQKLNRCVVCGKAMPPLSQYCSECKSYQGWWRRQFSVSPAIPALLTVLLGVVTTGLIPLFSWWMERNSYTIVKVTGADPNHIFMKVWNTGRRPSTLVAYRLKFDKYPKKEFVLDLSQEDKKNATNVIASGQPQRIMLTDPAWPQNKPFTADEWRQLTSQSPVASSLEVDVRESDDIEDEAAKIHTRHDHFNADLIAAFLPEVAP